MTLIRACLTVAALALLALAPLVASPDSPREGEIFSRVKCVLEGKPSTVALRAYGVGEIGCNGQLVVLDSTGKVRWAGPRQSRGSRANPLTFGRWDYGVAEIEAVGNLLGDGRTTLVAPYPVSDVRPVIYRVLVWKDHAFRWLRDGALLATGPRYDRFTWTTRPPATGTWVAHFRGFAPDGTCTVDVTQYGGGGEAKTGVAQLRPTGNGYTVTRWTQGLH